MQDFPGLAVFSSPLFFPNAQNPFSAPPEPLRFPRLPPGTFRGTHRCCYLCPISHFPPPAPPPNTVPDSPRRQTRKVDSAPTHPPPLAQPARFFYVARFFRKSPPSVLLQLRPLPPPPPPFAVPSPSVRLEIVARSHMYLSPRSCFHLFHRFPLCPPLNSSGHRS